MINVDWVEGIPVSNHCMQQLGVIFMFRERPVLLAVCICDISSGRKGQQIRLNDCTTMQEARKEV